MLSKLDTYVFAYKIITINCRKVNKFGKIFIDIHAVFFYNHLIKEQAGCAVLEKPVPGFIKQQENPVGPDLERFCGFFLWALNGRNLNGR